MTDNKELAKRLRIHADYLDRTNVAFSAPQTIREAADALEATLPKEMPRIVRPVGNTFASVTDCTECGKPLTEQFTMRVGSPDAGCYHYGCEPRDPPKPKTTETWHERVTKKAVAAMWHGISDTPWSELQPKTKSRAYDATDVFLDESAKLSDEEIAVFEQGYVRSMGDDLFRAGWLAVHEFRKRRVK